jgi:hypothetical protein
VNAVFVGSTSYPLRYSLFIGQPVCPRQTIKHMRTQRINCSPPCDMSSAVRRSGVVMVLNGLLVLLVCHKFLSAIGHVYGRAHQDNQVGLRPGKESRLGFLPKRKGDFPCGMTPFLSDLSKIRYGTPDRNSIITVLFRSCEQSPHFPDSSIISVATASSLPSFQLSGMSPVAGPLKCPWSALFCWKIALPLKEILPRDCGKSTALGK